MRTGRSLPVARGSLLRHGVRREVRLPGHRQRARRSWISEGCGTVTGAWAGSRSCSRTARETSFSSSGPLSSSRERCENRSCGRSLFARATDDVGSGAFYLGWQLGLSLFGSDATTQRDTFYLPRESPFFSRTNEPNGLPSTLCSCWTPPRGPNSSFAGESLVRLSSESLLFAFCEIRGVTRFRTSDAEKDRIKEG